MKDLALSEILNRHAEALIAGRAVEAKRLAAELGHEEMAGLFNVAGRLKSALKPVTPRAEFVASLKQQLVRESRLIHRQTERRQQVTWLAIGIGSLVYSVGLFAMSVRATWWFIGLVALALGWRKRSELVKAPQTVRR